MANNSKNVNSKFDIAEKISAMESTIVDSNPTDVESIVKSCLEKGNFKLFKNLSVKTVAATTTLDGKGTRTRCTFSIKGNIWGMKSGKDSFGMETRIPGMADNFTVSAYSLAGAMRANGNECGLLARDISNMSANIPENAEFGDYPLNSRENIADIIFTGGTIDVLAEYVPAGEQITSPFSKNHPDDTETKNTDRVVHYIVGCQLGKFGIKKLEKLI